MKKFKLSLLFLFIPLTALCQLTSLGLKGINYKSQMEIVNDTLYVASFDGLYRKNMKHNSDWEQFEFKGLQVRNFARWNDDWIASCTFSGFRKDSMLFYAPAKQDTIIDYTFFENDTAFTNSGTTALSPIFITQQPSSRQTLYAATDIGTYKSPDFGKTWTYISQYAFEANGLIFDPKDERIMLEYGESWIMSGIILRMNDKGELLNSHEAPGGDDQISDVVFCHSNPDIALYVSSFGKIGKSTDAGKSWEMVYGIEPNGLVTSNCMFYDIVEDTNTAGTFYASGWQHDTEDMIYIYRTKDYGETWEIAWKENLQGEERVKVLNIIMHGDELILQTNVGLYSLNVKTTPTLMESTTAKNKTVTITYNAEARAIYAETESPISAITLTDAAGRIVCSDIQQDRVNAATLSDGIYLITVQTKDGESTVQKLHIK
jgi:hypothetical protein